MGSHGSKEDDVNRISSSIYVTNFPESFSAKDLFHACKQYGHVVDSFIPTKRSKEGKRFGFVHFINVFNVERFVSNLRTIWVDRFKFHANIARFHRAPLNSRKIPVQNKDERHRGGVNNHRVNGGIVDNGKSFANVVKNNSMPSIVVKESDLAIVIDDDCVQSKDLSCSLLGRVKEFDSLINLKTTLYNEGFVDMKHPLISILMVELCGWRRYGRELLSFEKVVFVHKLHSNIFESFKIVFKGKVFRLRAKEVPGWEPELLEEFDDEVQSENASLEGDDKTQDEDYGGYNSDIAEVPETVFDDSIGRNENVSDDPFGIYSILNKNNADKNDKGNTDNQSFQYPPGFTPIDEENGSRDNKEKSANSNVDAGDKGERELLEESDDEVQSENASLEGDCETQDEDYGGDNSDMAEVPETVFDDSIGPKENVSDDPWPPRVTLGRLLPHARGFGFKPCRKGFPSEAKKEWGLSPKAKDMAHLFSIQKMTAMSLCNATEVVPIEMQTLLEKNEKGAQHLV
nr:nucleotide-binding alpha-beta plait domain-containing protein [Tanacetum cinerariifolium]